MQCQDCTALTHRLSSQLEKKKARARGNSEGGGLSEVLQRIAQLGAGSAEPQRPASARHRGVQEPARPLHQHNCLWSASPLAGPAPPTSCDQIRPGKASLNLRRLAGAGDFQQTSPPLWSLSPPSPGPGGAPRLALLEQATRLVPFTPRSGGDGDEMFGNPSGLPGKCVCDVGEDTSRFLPQRITLWFWIR